MRAESNSEPDLVAWDAAPTECFENPFPHVAEEETSLEGDRDEGEDMEVTQPQQVRAGSVKRQFSVSTAGLLYVGNFFVIAALTI